VLVGFTASGKKKVGVTLAERIDAEIISLDSMKVYRQMDIGTAKPSSADRRRVPFHLLDVVDPCESFSVGKYLEAARDRVREIHERRRRVLFLGGTALYMNRLLHGLFSTPPLDPRYKAELLDDASRRGTLYLHGRLRGADPASALTIHQNDLKRIVRALEVIHATGKPLSWLKANRTMRMIPNPAVVAGLRWPRETLEERIRRRTRKMLEAGLVEEVRRILADPGFGSESGKAIGYAEIIDHLYGRLSLSEAEEAINRNSLSFATKQETWYRRVEEMRWVAMASAVDLDRAVDELAEYFLTSESELTG